MGRRKFTPPPGNLGEKIPRPDIRYAGIPFNHIAAPYSRPEK
jgi:hypothetical protein